MTTVLFVHGLESGPRGQKSLALEQAGFTVVAGQMPCGRRAAVRDPLVIGLVVLALGLLFAASSRGAIGFLICVMSFAALGRFVSRTLMRRMFRRSVAVQRALLATHPIDVVLGSSFGGAVALELLASGAWKGPTVLLCPAHRLVAERSWRPAPALPEDASRVVVVHGRQDETVPPEHSHSLVRGTAAKLVEVDDEHRLAVAATPEQLAAWIELARGAHE